MGGAPRPVVLAVTAAWVTLPLGLLVAPQLWSVWCVLGGAAQGGGLVVVFAMVVRHARDLTENRQMSAAVQGFSYVVAAGRPPGGGPGGGAGAPRPGQGFRHLR